MATEEEDPGDQSILQENVLQQYSSYVFICVKVIKEGRKLVVVTTTLKI